MSRRLFIVDKKSKITFLVDTGADFSVWPASPHHKWSIKHDNNFTLFAANGSTINTYGEKIISLDVGL